MKKILDLRNMDNLTNKEFSQLEGVLRKIAFLNHQQKKVHPRHKHIKERYTILRKSPDKADKLNGQDYIREDYIEENGEIICARIYDFNGKVISSCD